MASRTLARHFLHNSHQEKADSLCIIVIVLVVVLVLVVVVVVAAAAVVAVVGMGK